MKYYQLLNFVLLLSPCVLGFESYSGYKVYDVLPNKIQHEQLSQWQYYDGIDFWRLKQPNYNSTVMVEPEQQKDFEKFLTTNQIPFLVQIQDVGPIVEEEHYKIQERIQISPLSGQSVISADFSVYWSSHEMERYCARLAAEYPRIVEIETVTTSPEGRRIFALKISSDRNFGRKPIIAMEGGMHAREWASPPTVLYLIHKLVQDPSSRDELLEKVDWLIVPMLNPDGYEYTRTEHRMWRKNRRVISEDCIGVDLNRNFGYTWRPALNTINCTFATYPGPAPLSEPEALHLNRIMSRYARNIKLYLSVHTHGDMVLWPWGYEGSPGWIHSHIEHQRLGELWKNAILRENGRTYEVGNVADILSNAFGAVDDHMAGFYKVPYVYTLELTSGHDFLYPEEQIGTLVNETFHGYRAMALFIGEEYGGALGVKASWKVLIVMTTLVLFYYKK